MKTQLKPLLFTGLFLLKGCAINQIEINNAQSDIYKNIFFGLTYETTTGNVFDGKLNGMSFTKPYIKLFTGEGHEQRNDKQLFKNNHMSDCCGYFLENNHPNGDK